MEKSLTTKAVKQKMDSDEPIELLDEDDEDNGTITVAEPTEIKKTPEVNIATEEVITNRQIDEEKDDPILNPIETSPPPPSPPSPNNTILLNRIIDLEKQLATTSNSYTQLQQETALPEGWLDNDQVDPWDDFELTTSVASTTTTSPSVLSNTARIISSNPYHIVARTRYEVAEAIATLNQENIVSLMKICSTSLILAPETNAMESVLKLLNESKDMQQHMQQITLQTEENTTFQNKQLTQMQQEKNTIEQQMKEKETQRIQTLKIKQQQEKKEKQNQADKKNQKEIEHCLNEIIRSIVDTDLQMKRKKEIESHVVNQLISVQKSSQEEKEQKATELAEQQKKERIEKTSMSLIRFQSRALANFSAINLALSSLMVFSVKVGAHPSKRASDINSPRANWPSGRRTPERISDLPIAINNFEIRRNPAILPFFFEVFWILSGSSENSASMSPMCFSKSFVWQRSTSFEKAAKSQIVITPETIPNVSSERGCRRSRALASLRSWAKTHLLTAPRKVAREWICVGFNVEAVSRTVLAANLIDSLCCRSLSLGS